MWQVWLQSFGLKIILLLRATYLVSVGNNIKSHWLPVASPTISHALLPMTLKADKLSMDTEAVALDNKLSSRLTQLIIVALTTQLTLTRHLINILVDS